MKLRCKLGIHKWDYYFWSFDEHKVPIHAHKRECVHCEKHQVMTRVGAWLDQGKRGDNMTFTKK